MKRNIAAVLVAFVFVAALFAVARGPVAIGAPMAGPTPVAAAKSASGATPVVVELFNNRAMTADTTSPCVEVSAYEKADIYYSIDQGTTNTTTLTLRHGNTPTALVNGINIAAANTADAADMNQFTLYGRYLCVLADVTNSNTITITVNALVK